MLGNFSSFFDHLLIFFFKIKVQEYYQSVKLFAKVFNRGHVCEVLFLAVTIFENFIE